MNLTDNLSKIEENAWESFEVGSFDEVKVFLKHSPDSPFLKNLTIIADWEDSKRTNPSNKAHQDNCLFDITNSYIESMWGRRDDALKYLKKYASNSNSLLCLSFITFGIKLSLDLDDYQFCLYWINLNNDNTLEKFYCKEKIYCLFGLKKHLELIQYFKSVYNLVDNDSDVMLKVGLSLHALGKFKESEYLLEKIPDKVNLPSFEERKKEFTGIISNIKSLEKKENLSFDELKDLGFAYLFNSDYAKAEEIFRKASFAIE